MKRYIRSSVNSDMIAKAIDFAKDFKGAIIDSDNKHIEIPFSSSSTEEDLMSEGMLGRWFADNGFDIHFEKKDVEYITQDTWRNARGWNREKGHTAYLRNRLVGIIEWR